MKKILAILLVMVAISLAALAGYNWYVKNNEPPHEHTYEEEWSYDANEHWHAANCEHTEERKDIAEHTDAEPIDGKCDVCGMQYYLPEHTHADEDSDGKCDIYGENLYTIKFVNGETEISSALAAPGEFVNIPESPVDAENSRVSFTGWLGISDVEMAQGKVEVFYSDATYYANWEEMFGTEQVFEISKVRDIYNITADGVMEAEYSDATPIVIAKDEFGTTAVAYVLWSETHFYIFVDVKDSTVSGGDFVELRLDLLHSDKHATSAWDESWNTGEAYRLSASSEGGWKICSGASDTERYFEYWSNLTRERNSSFGYSIRNDEGYTVEWVIKVEDNGFADLAALGTDLYPHLEQQIGIGILVNDEGNGWVGADNFDGYNSGPKRLSNAVLVENEVVKNHEHTFDEEWSFDANNHWHKATCWHENEIADLGAHVDEDVKDGYCDVCGAAMEIPEHTHVDADGDGKCDLYNETVYDVEIKNGDTVLYTYCVTHGTEITLPAADELVAPDRYYFIGWNGATEEENEAGKLAVTADRSVSAVWKEQFGSDTVFEIVQLRDSTVVSCDGVMDDAYLDAKPINVVYGNDQSSAVAYVLWSEEYFYVFIDVKDATLDSDDNIQMRIDLLHTDAYATDSYDGSWNLDGQYRLDASVQGGWKVKRGAAGRDGDFGDYWSHLNKERGTAQGCSISTDTGYTVEFIIKVEDNGFSTFTDLGVNLYPHVGQEIGIGMVVQDWNNPDIYVEDFEGYYWGGHRKISNAILVENENVSDHEHTYEEEWTYDADNHWHKASCWHEDLVSDLGAHVDEDVKDGYCDVCGAAMEIPEHTHVDADGDGKCDLYNEIVYDVEIKNGDTVLYTYCVTHGTEITLPAADELVAPDRHYLVGWNGATEEENEAGKLAVTADRSVSAVWKEQFGSDTVFEIVQLRDSTVVNCDGVMDDAYLDAKPINVVYGNDQSSAVAYILWSEEYFYVFIDVKDATFDSNDNIQMRIDLLHTDEFATDAYDGSWDKDGEYRLGASAQGGWKVKRGAAGRDGDFGDYWSHLNKERGTASGYSVSTDTGYTVEFIIKVEDNGFSTFTDLGVNLYPHVGQEIGIGMVIQDWNNSDIYVEDFEGYYWGGHRKISNAVLIENEIAKNHEHTYSEEWSFDEDNHWHKATCWHENEIADLGAHVDESVKDGLCDVCGAAMEIPEHTHVDADGDGKCDIYNEDVYKVEFINGETVIYSAVGVTGDTVAIPADPGEAPASTANQYVFDYWSGLTEDQLAAGEVVIENSNLSFSAVWKEGFGTDLVVEMVQLAEGATITCDGIKDEAYSSAKPITISRDGFETTAVAYLMWSETHYYIFIEVNDTSYNAGDAVQIRMDLLHDDSFATSEYNGTWDKDGSYRLDASVQGGWKVKRGAAGRDGDFGDYWSHLNKERGTAQGCSISTDTGYTVEFIIKVEDNGFSTFTDMGVNLYPHVGQEIGIGICVQDWENYDVCLENYDGYFYTGHRKITNAVLVAAE